MKNTNTSNVMDNILISTIRLGAIAGVALLTFVGEVFAAPILPVPVVVSNISENKATLSSVVETPPFKTALVWFDYWGDTPTSVVSTEARSRSGVEHFKWDISDLRSCTTYSFRAVAREGGVTVLSSNVGSFTTKGCPLKNTQTAQSTQTTQATQIKNDPMATKATVPAATMNTNANTNSSAASVVGASGVLPGTLIGWVALLISVLVALLITFMIFEASENRKKKLAHGDDGNDEEEEGEVIKQ